MKNRELVARTIPPATVCVCVSDRLCECASEYVNKTYPLQKLEQPSLCEALASAGVLVGTEYAICCLRMGVWVRFSPLAAAQCLSGSIPYVRVCVCVCVFTKCYRCSDAQKGWFHLTRNDRRMILAWTIQNLQKFHSFFIFSFCSSVRNSAQNRRHHEFMLCFAQFFFRVFFFLTFFLLWFAVLANEHSIFAHTMPITYFMPFYYWFWMWTESNNENASVAQIIIRFHCKNVQ